jgi:hypothetical protein
MGYPLTGHINTETWSTRLGFFIRKADDLTLQKRFTRNPKIVPRKTVAQKDCFADDNDDDDDGLPWSRI